MHELAVTESLLKTACDYANRNNAHKVDSLNITIGDLSSIISDSVQFYWDIISKNTVCERAVLNFNRIPAKFICIECEIEFELDGRLCPCPQCGGFNIKTSQGDEFLLESIDIEKRKLDGE
jgi:hydrogenase nickel incorporation protein HypA/HybF